MSYTSAAYNRHIMNKMLWMSRNLRNLNDTLSINSWAHTMSILKSLILPPLPSAPENIPQPSPTQAIIPQPVRSISSPHTICFQPATTMPLTQSAPRCTINEQGKTTPLTTFTLRLPNIASCDSLPQLPKRRKLSVPPSVDYNASTVTPLPTSTTAAASPTKTTPISTTNHNDSNSPSLYTPTVTRTCKPTSKPKSYDDLCLPKRCLNCWESRKPCFCERYERMSPAQRKKCFNIT